MLYILKKINFGFTLVELLVVSVILAVVSAAIFSTFNSGLKVWQRINTQVPKEDLNIFLDKFTYDVKNCFEFKGIGFSGTKDKFSFATIVDSPRLNKRTVGEIVYYYKSDPGALFAERLDYSQVYQGKNGMVVASLNNIKYAQFRYFVYDRAERKFAWQDTLSQDEAPLAVSLELELKEDAGNEKITNKVGIPVGSRFYRE